ncbi:MAG TPA: NlpC/P60 family protein [Streptosporangiaceae bacterium]|nr:NlpC/P60 family protein [Streptosporangiaceae bacterium]
MAAAAILAGMAAVFVFQAPANAALAAPTAITARAVTAKPASATLTAAHRRRRHRGPARLRAYAWALRQKGHPYVWGGIGPGFDCSGLVMMAYRHAGVRLPRTTTEMLASHLLVWTRHPRKGDLAFYGTGHVELFRKWGYTYGAHDSGTVVSLIHYGWGWRPTAYYRLRIFHRRHRR